MCAYIANTKEVSVVRPHRNAPSVNERPDDLRHGENIISRNARRRCLAQLKVIVVFLISVFVCFVILCYLFGE